jgi:hypothetical protein
MTAHIITARSIQAYKDALDAGAENPELEAAGIAAFESRDLVQEIVLTVSECLADGKNELTALAEATRRFSGTSSTTGTTGTSGGSS